MALGERQKEIFALLQERERLGVKELAEMLYVSEMTVRRDLALLESEGYIKRFRGGAFYNAHKEYLPISNRVYVNEDEKKQLAAKAAGYLRDGINVFLDSSSTCSYLVGHIKKYRNIRVFTNSVKTLELTAKWHIPCTLIGGEYDENDMCLVGELAEAMAAAINVDVAFFTTRGYADDGAITEVGLPQTAVRRHILRNAKQNVFLFEQDKLHKKYIYTLCHATDENVAVILL